MAATIAPSNVAFDPSSFMLRYHLSTFPTTKFTPAPEDLKQEKIGQLGEQYQQWYTPGVVETGEAEVEMLTVVWKKLLGVLPDPMSSAVFPMTGNERHPTITGSYSIICDDCGIIGTKHGIEAGEKANRITFKLRVMRVLYRGDAGGWKMLGRRPGVSLGASASAQALMQF